MATYTGAASVLKDASFRERIVVGLVETSEKILTEAASTPYHSERVVMAKKVIESNTQAIEAAVGVLVGINSGAIQVNEPDKGLTDTAIAAACAADWNTIAGIDQGQ